MLNSQLYEILQSQKSSSSGTGTSYYGTPASCGMKSRLYERYTEAKNEEELEEANEYEESYTKTGRKKVSGKRAGAFYHKLQELWRLGTIPSNLVIDASHVDYDYQVACTSFNGYRQRFGANIHNLGRVHSAEVTLPRNEAEAAIIKAAFGGKPFTIRYDLLTDISEADCYRIAAERNIAIPGPGLYIIDYKLLASIGKATGSKYTHEFQQMAYPVVYNLLNPEKPVRGMLTDVVARVQKPEDKHFGLYLADASSDAYKIVRDGIAYAARQHLEGRANAFACQGTYGPCGHLTSGLCPRYGKFDDFKWNDDKTFEPLIQIGARHE